MNTPLQIIYVPIDELPPYSRNARMHSKRQIKLIAKSIEANGGTNPILTIDDGEIIAGHGRCEATTLLGLGVTYWARTATMIWHAYAHLIAIRGQNERITRQDIERREKLKERRAAAAERKRRSRARRPSTRSPGPSDVSDARNDSGGNPSQQKDHPS